MTSMKQNGNPPPKTSKQRTYVRQSDLPSLSIDEAMRVPTAIADNYAKQATKPLDVAIALNMSPTSGPFRTLCGAALGYGLTDAGPTSARIGLTPLGQRVVAPLEEGDDLVAKQEAVLTPTVVGTFLRKYDGNQLPSETIAKNVLKDLGVDPDAAGRAFTMIKANAQSVGFLKPVKDKTFVDLGAQPTPQAAPTVEGAEPIIELVEQPVPQPPAVIPPAPERTDGLRNRRVYISHGKNLKIVQHLKDLISYGELEPVVSVETESPSKPVPKKVMDDMRSCSAGIIHVSGEETLTDGSGKERHIVNQNVLIEIGAAMALYGDRFILLVEEGASLPSNLQGLYEVRYSGGGSELGHEATMRLLKIFAEFKSGPSS
jgi:hypothetical protein